MDSIEELALTLLETEKRYLLEDKGEYCAAVVVVITPEGRYWDEATFNDEDQKVKAYTAIVARAKEQNAEAIITINSSRQLNLSECEALDSYWWGKLEGEECSRALTLTASGPEIEPWCISIPYRLENGEVEMGEASKSQPALIGLLPDWP